MASLIVASINLKDIPKKDIKEVTRKNGEKGLYAEICIAVNDETRFGNNCSIYMSQTEEERKAKINRNYIGNGRVKATDGVIKLYEKEDSSSAVSSSSDEGLPF